MNHILKILKYTSRDLIRSKIVPVYTSFFLLLWGGLFYFSSDAGKTAASLIQVITAIIPLVSLIFGSMIYYNSADFIVFMMTQPVKRSSIFIAMNSAVALVLSVCVIAGLGIPALLTGNAASFPLLFVLLTVSVVLTWVFSGLAFFIGVLTADKVQALSISVFVWLFFTVLFDGLILLVTVYFYDYPVEVPVLLLSALNPADISRILLLMQIDHSALMGYTGALYKSLFSTSSGIAISFALLMLWYLIPFRIGFRLFNKKDF